MKALTVTLRQPAQLSTSLRSDGLIDTVSHVPGSVVRGALAAAWIRTHGAPERAPARDTFLRLFEGEVRFGPLYAGAPPSPLSVHRHKYASEPACTTAYLDAAASGTFEKPAACADCGQEWVPLRPGHSPEARHVRTSVAIDSTKHTAKPGQLFSRRRLRSTLPIRDDSGRLAGHAVATFTGEVTGDDALVDSLATLQRVRIGGRKTSHGAVTIAFSDTGATQLWVRDDGVLVFALSSPAIYVDAEGRPTNAPTDGELSRVLGCDATVVKAWTRWDTVGGWHGASGLPKPTETVVTAGSTYAVRLADPPRADLAALVAQGVGLRRHEGFGHIGRYLMPTRSAAEVEAAAESLAASVTEDDLLPFVAFRYAQGVIPADLADAIRAAAADDSLVTEAAALARRYGGAFTGARDAKKAEQLLALPPAKVNAIVTRLEQ